METVIVTSDNKDDAYVATVLLFNNVRHMAESKIGGWELVSCFTSNDQEQYQTRYSNGKMFIQAETICGHHTYLFGAENE